MGKEWIDDNGFKHPFNWANTWSSDDLKKWGVTIETTTDTSFDGRFYSAKDVELKLADEKVVDGDGKAVIDAETGQQAIAAGLKSIWIESTKVMARTLLSSSDWYVTRKADIDEAIPSNIDTYRKAVRTAAASIESKINACSDLAAFKALFDKPVDSDNKPTGKAPIYDWPDEVS